MKDINKVIAEKEKQADDQCREEEIKRLREAIAWTYRFDVSEPTNGRQAHICRYYLRKRLTELGGAE